MGLIESFQGKNACIDTAPVIYFVEKHPVYLSVVRPLFEAIDTGNIFGMTLTVTLLEVLVHPLKMDDTVLAERYREILLSSEHFMTLEILHAFQRKPLN